ncbi:tape measure protein [Streptococcus thermophilus]|uniref:tape measure protein n=1 Tax=Streptococcus thermophilus TaxID=1308 RepID=UPI0022FDC022|nr:tape measure protein [Streptococcus thermophilus]MDA5537971.1 tape measure protein [Streptococcus thermophilus]MDA5552516.1 tape measure protein [Streptococcus thermophilus]WCL60745.1 tape measure protein [Streptococcus thermophilus]
MAKVQATMSTEIALDTLQAANSIKRLTQLVNSSTNAWKAQESQMRSAGDYLGAAQAKFDGLSNTIENQQKKIEKLKQEQSELKGNTVEVAEQYLKYQQQIDQATTRLAALENQQRQAKQSLDYHKSGLAELQKEYKAQNEASETYVKRLKAEGKEDEARQEQLKQYKGAISNLNKQYETQKEMLERIAKQSGKTSDEYRKQKQRLDETATSMAHARNAAEKLNDEIKEIQHSRTIVGRLKNSFEHLGNEIDKTETKTSRLKGLFSATFAANLISNSFLNVLGSIKGKFDEIAQSSAEYVKYQQTMNATWLTLTGNAEEGQKMVDMTNQMAQAAANSTEMVDSMNQKFYAVTHNTELTKQQTQAILTLQDAFGQTDAAVENFSTQWAQMIANGKVQGQDMMSIINVFPEMKNQLKEVAAQELGIADMTQDKYAELQHDGKITAEMAQKALFELQEKYKDATANFSTTIGGLERTLQSRMPAVVAAFRDPIDKMKNPFLQQIGNWVADPNTETKFKELGEHVSKGLGTIMDAFSKVFNLGNGTDKLNSLMDNLNRFVDNISQKIANNAPKIVAFFKETKDSLIALFSIGKNFASGAWEAATGMIKVFAKALDKIFNRGKKAKQPIKSISDALASIAQHKAAIKAVGAMFVSYFVSSKIASGITGVTKGVVGFVKGIKAWKKATTELTLAQKLLNLAMASNPIGFIMVGVTMAITGFVMLYKHSKKFKKFVDGFVKGLGKVFGSVGKFFSNIGKGIGKFFSKVGKEHKKRNEKELEITRKHNKEVAKLWSKNWNNLKKGVSTFWNNIVKTNKNKNAERAKLTKKHNEEIKKWWNTHWNNLKDGVSRSWKSIVDKTKKSASEHAELIKQRGNEISDKWNKSWNSMKDFVSDRWNDIQGNTKKGVSNLAKSIREKHKEIHDKWSKTWENSKNYLSNKWNEIQKDAENKFGKGSKTFIVDNLSAIGSKFQDTWNKSKDYISNKWDEIQKDAENKFGGNIKNSMFDHLSAIGKKFQEIWDGIKNGFSELWNGMKNLAKDGINAVIKLPNDGIDGINKLISDFGGSKNAISKIPEVKFANGTGLFNSFRNPITEPTLATLNDGNDSPETNNQEMVILPNGKTFLPKGRNVEYLLPAGSEVINASELAMLMGIKQGAYAKGTGFWSKIWNTTTNVAGSVWDAMRDGVDKFRKMIEFIGDAIKDPVGTLSKKFSPNSDKLDGMFSHLGNALYKKPVEEAKNWWKELWSMANSSMDEGTMAMGAKGDDYRFKHKAKDSGADPWGYYFRECVSFIASRLANLGVNQRLFSHLGDGRQWINARVPHLSRPKPGTVAVYNGGPVSSNHVDFVTAVHGDTYDGEEYNFLGDGQYHQYTGRHIRNAATFLDFGIRDFGSSGDDGKPLKDRNNPLQTLIKRQVGGMFDWIKKTLGPLLSPQSGGEDHPQGNSVARWRKHVIKALKANGIEPTDFRVSKILATIQKESGGNPNAQNNWDINARMGDPSIGLMQTIGRTFNAYKHPGHNNIRNGYDNLLAAINYIKHRYGTSDAAFNYVATHGYANGGLVRKNGVYELAEGDMPEYVIPTDIAKRGRAWQLLTEAVAHFAGDAPQGNNDNTSNHQRVSILEDKLDVMIGLLSQLVTNESKPIEIKNIIDGTSVSNGLAPFMTKATNDYERRQALLGGSII